MPNTQAKLSGRAGQQTYSEPLRRGGQFLKPNLTAFLRGEGSKFGTEFYPSSDGHPFSRLDI